MLDCVRLEFTERRTTYNLEGRSHYSQKVTLKVTHTHTILESLHLFSLAFGLFSQMLALLANSDPRLDCGPTKAIAAYSNNFQEAAISIDLTTSSPLLWYSVSLKEFGFMLFSASFDLSTRQIF